MQKKIDVFIGDAWSSSTVQEGYHTFRIPALVQASKGDLLAICEARRDSASDAGKIDLVLKRSNDGGATWGETELIWGESGDTTIGNPTPIVDRTGIIHLLFCRNNREAVLYTRSDDDGKSWRTPHMITDADGNAPAPGVQVIPDYNRTLTRMFGVDVYRFGTGPGHGVQLKSGRLIVPFWMQGSTAEPYPGPELDPAMLTEEQLTAINTRDPSLRYFAGILYSDDNGATWQAGGLSANGTNESMVVELPDGRLLMNSRFVNGTYRVIACSVDGGLNWTTATFDRTLIDPQCQGSMLTCITPDKRAALLFVNLAQKDKSGARTTLTARLSEDNGTSWPFARVIEEGRSAYSDLCLLPDGNIGVLYERGVERYCAQITFTAVEVEWVRGSEF